MRCADVAEKVSAAHPEWLQRHKQVLLSFASTVQEKEVRWHMAQMIPRLELSPSERRRAVALLFKYLEDGSQIVKTFSMQALFEMSAADAKLRAQVVPILQGAVHNGSPAVRSGAKKLLTAIDREPARPARDRDAV
jgi:HEAT repeat protein